MTNKLQTPYYVVDCEILEGLTSSLKQASAEFWPNTRIGYSFKTNSLPWIIRYMKMKGFLAEVVSDDEFRLAEHIGFRHEDIIFNGPVKSKDVFLSAIKNKAIVNIDSHREIGWLLELQKTLTSSPSVGIRVNFDLEKYCPCESSAGQDGGRFGFSYEGGELSKVIADLASHGVNVEGLHLHTSSKTRSRNVYKAICKMACNISKEYDLSLHYIDIGGGFFGGVPEKPQFKDYFSDMAGILTKHFDKTTMLIIEPGMSVVGAAVRYITSVIDVKDTEYGCFVVTDGSRTHIDPLMTKKSYFYVVRDADGEIVNERTKLTQQKVVGFTCMENDRLMAMVDQYELKEGDCIEYHKVGAYTMCLSPQFIQFSPPVYVSKNGALAEVKRRGTVSDYVSLSKEYGVG